MDFVTHLPRTMQRHDAVWVVRQGLRYNAHRLATLHRGAETRRRGVATRPRALRHGALGDDTLRVAQRRDTAECALCHSHDTMPDAPRYSRPSAQRARNLGSGCAPRVHPTQS